MLPQWLEAISRGLHRNEVKGNDQKYSKKLKCTLKIEEKIKTNQNDVVIIIISNKMEENVQNEVKRWLFMSHLEEYILFRGK